MAAVLAVACSMPQSCLVISRAGCTPVAFEHILHGLDQPQPLLFHPLLLCFGHTTGGCSTCQLKRHRQLRKSEWQDLFHTHAWTPPYRQPSCQACQHL
jgi:hypothetical protein